MDIVSPPHPARSKLGDSAYYNSLHQPPRLGCSPQSLDDKICRIAAFCCEF